MPSNFSPSSIGGPLPVVDLMPSLRRQAFGGAQHMQLGLKHGARGVARRRAARLGRQGAIASAWSRICIGELRRARRSSLDLLSQARVRGCAGVKVERCLVISLEHAAGVALVDRVAQLVRCPRAGAR